MAKRVSFLIDGFNIYHSARDLERYERLKVKWLDYHSLFRSYLHLFGKDSSLESIYYFTALAHHLNDVDLIKRHEAYIRCLRETGVKDQQGRFKVKSPVKCARCGHSNVRYEEKETDVAIASKMFEKLHNDECDCIVLVTGDTDLVPAVETAQRLFPTKQIVFAFPYRRINRELAKLAPGSFKIGKDKYTAHQLQNPFVLSDGTTIAKPSSW